MRIFKRLNLVAVSKQAGPAAGAAGNAAGGNSQPERIIALLGGRENIEFVDACMTRLRVTVKDISKVAELPAWKAEGAMGLVKPLPFRGLVGKIPRNQEEKENEAAVIKEINNVVEAAIGAIHMAQHYEECRPHAAEINPLNACRRHNFF